MINSYRIFFIILFTAIFYFSPTAAAGEKTIEVIVGKNDNVLNICKVYLENPGRCPEITRLNHLEKPDLIFPGQKIIIPVNMLKGIPLEGNITFIKGEVKVRGKGDSEWRSAAMDEPIMPGDSIETGAEGAVEISYENGDSFFLRPDTSIDVKTSSINMLKNVVRKLYLRVGRTITKIKEATGKKSRNEIQTPSSVAAARGTEFRVTVDENETTRTEVLKGLVGVEAREQKVEVKEGQGTVVKMNEPPAKPRELLSPPSPVRLEKLYRSMPAVFQFESIAGAKSYRVMLARDADLKDVVKSKIIDPHETLNITGINDGMYYLQSRSIDKEGLEGLPLDAVNVHVRVNPLPPFIQQPVDKSELREKAVEFEWLKVKDAVRYHLQVSTNSEFINKVIDTDDIRDTKYSSDIFEFTTYYFRLSSISSDEYEGVWSDVQSFSIIPPPPAPPVEEPEMSEKEIHVRWSDFGEGIVYHFQMAADEDFSDIIIDERIDEPNITINKPEKRGTYYVRTRGIDKEGFEGDFSLPQTFKIQGSYYEALAAIGSMVLIFLLAP